MQFSIIIPTYNSEKYIKQCLDSIKNLDYKDYEVIVIDNNSTDSTLNIVKNYNIKLFHSKTNIISSARNQAAEKANGNYLAFIDSDCIVNKNLLNLAETHLKQYAACGSFYKPKKDANWVAKAWLLVENKPKGEVDWLPGGTLIVKKEIFNEIQGFNQELQTGEDFDFCHRLTELGYKIYNDPKMASIHIGQTENLKDFIKKEMWRGRSLLKGIKQHGLAKSELPSTVLTFFHLYIGSMLIISIFIDQLLFAINVLFLIGPSVLLAIKKSIEKKKPPYIFFLFIIILTYQISRAFSIYRYWQFKDL